MDNLLGNSIKFHVSVGRSCQTFYDQKIGMRRCNYEQFLDDLHKCGAGDCRFGIFDIEYACDCVGGIHSPGYHDRLLLVHWCPEGADDTKKMLYAAGLKALHQILGERQVIIKATDLAEPTLARAIEECRALDCVPLSTQVPLVVQPHSAEAT
ncbi:cofilin/actin-depolymerizing factor homolog isoform X2 [Scaptodrosophila lebanonensis]|uniref:Cofilin/actin-depolymerizing factor homolog isoform X2 n=1 Tax=Drosophila lebanonensis TaxID=7225 RepID=A0A6J2U3D5_DROLE|nr:cofilin/actin-depolymerizing factor homolog isoform X2 [Scaptodrosophila lebanonensis]